MRQQSAANILTVIILLAIIGAVICAGSASIAGYTFQWNDGGLVAHNPQAEANAARVALLAQQEAARAKALADKAAIDAQAENDARAAAAMGKRLTYIGLGAGVLIACVGLALALVGWVNKRANETRPNAAGIFPVIVKPVAGGVIVHDPNRAIGPTTIYTTPSIAGAVAERAGLPIGQATVDAPLSATEGAHVQIASQAQAVQLMSAATRPQALFGVSETRKPEDTAKLITAAISAGAGVAGRLPKITIIDDPAQVAGFEQKLLEASE